jgi:para-nitrobenzyl esterase
MSEDCLHLNVLTPAKKTTDRLPVLVWIHGGGITDISGNRKSYNTPYLPQAGVVLVTVSHRLGAIGYFAHPSLTAESPNHASGNYGNLDLIAALKWVKKNIASFGGDPERVAIFGQSGGGRKVHWLMCSPLAKGLFRGAIVHSGSQTTVPLEQAEQAGENLAAKLGASDLAALRAKSWQEIITVSRASGSGYTDNITVDGWSLPDTFTNTYEAGRQKDVPLIIGLVPLDGSSTFYGTTELLPTIRQLHSKIYAYLFTHVPTGWKLEGVKAYHTIDMPYVFAGLEEIVSQWERYAKPQGSTNPDPGFDWKDEYMIDAMTSMWIQFAETGNPSVKGLVRWPAYDYRTDRYLQIDVPLEVESGFSELVQ